jgi:uncharacterized membrane protein YfcA
MLNFLIGLAVSILSGLGIGGGGLLVIFLVLVGGVGQLEAQGINLVFFLFSSGAAMIVHLIRRKLNFKLIFFLTLFGCIGAVIGSLIAQSCDPELIRRYFGILLILSGTTVLFKFKN